MHAMKKIVLTFAIAFGVTLAYATTASADTGGSATTDGGGIEHGVSIRIDIPTRHNTSSTKTPPCSYTWMDYPSDATIANIDGTPLPGDGTGQFFMLQCNDELVRAVYVRPGTPVEMADEAQRYLPVPTPRPRFAPPDTQIVNLATWLWIDEAAWFPLRSTVAVPGVSVSVTAEPETIEWTTGDGTVVVCEGPGTTFDVTKPSAVSSCTHTYLHASATQPDGAYSSQVTVRWHATWTVQGAAGGGDLGVIARTSPSSTRVDEVQAVNTKRN